jgi:hypothetical protein
VSVYRGGADDQRGDPARFHHEQADGDLHPVPEHDDSQGDAGNGDSPAAMAGSAARSEGALNAFCISQMRRCPRRPEPGQVSLAQDEDAIKASREAAERSELLRRHADRPAAPAEVAALLHSVDRVGRVLADLTCAEKDIADMLTRLADCGNPDWATQLRQQVQ